MGVTYNDSERNLIAAAKNLAVTMAEKITIEKIEEKLEDAIELGQPNIEALAKRELKDFIRARVTDDTAPF